MTSLGSAYLMDGDWDMCIFQSGKALEIEPHFGPAYNNIGLAYLEKGEHAKAVENFDKAQANGYDVEPSILAEIEQYR